MIAQLSVARQHRRASHTQNGTHKSLVEDLNVAVSKKCYEQAAASLLNIY